MHAKVLTFVAVLSCSLVSASQEQTRYSFAIDPSKPFAYLQYERIGPREPAREGEPPIGLWLKVVNNCGAAIRVATSGFQVLDEIAPVPEARDDVTGVIFLRGGSHGEQIYGEGGGVPYIPSSIPEPPSNSGPSSSRATPPKGYRTGVHRYSLLEIPPGEAHSFSVPINHVKSGEWYMRVELKIVAGNPGVISPSSYMDFFESQIPAEDLTKLRDMEQ